MSTVYRTPEPPLGVRKLGRYRLYGQLAQGRLGPVWLACTDPPGLAGPGKCVCVKQLDTTPPGLFAEVKRIGTFSHRNVCCVFELVPGLLSIEYVQGGPLSQLPRDPRLVAGVAQQVRAGIASAHARGIFHGALTADDVLVGTDGRAVVLGFGTARFRPGATPTAKQDLAALSDMFGDASGDPLPERAIGMRVADACALRVRHERALGATGGW